MRSKSFRAILTTVVCVFVSGSYALPTRTLAADQPTCQRTLSLKGEGSASVAPDLAWLRIGVDTQAAQARDALRANADAMAKIVTTLKSDGLADADVQTSNVSILPLYSNDPKKPRAVVGYRVSNMVTVRIRDLKQTGGIIDQVVALGSNDIANLRFDLDDSTVVENEARAAAVRDAIAKAKLYADTAGVELGPIVKIAEDMPGNIRPMTRMYSMAPAAAATPVESGKLTFRAVVDITWSIK